MRKTVKTIVLNNPKDVQDFSNIVSKYDFDISLKKGLHKKVDAKASFKDLLGMMVCQVKVVANGYDPAFSSDIQRFAIA